MDEQNRLKVLRLLEEAKDRVNSVTYLFLPHNLESRARTIERKLTDLFEDIREL